MSRCQGRNTGPRWAPLRTIQSPPGGTGVVIALKCQITNRSYVRTGVGGPGMPKSDVSKDEFSCLSRVIPRM